VDLGNSALPWRSLYLAKTIIAPGTTGNQSIGTIAGRVNFAAGATSLTVTCTNTGVVTSSSRVYPVISSNDATAVLKGAVAGTNTFTIYMSVAPTAETPVDFVVLP
jgi:hypothetical protein